MASGRPIDHVVLAVRNLDRAAEAYERLGFTLTPRAFHEDRMGTSNRLAQFSGRNFIEILEVDRPTRLAPHDFKATPPFFSFGDHNRTAVARREGLSMLVFTSEDGRADIARFGAANLPTFAPFDFERQARLPDGSSVTVSFTLAFARSPDMPEVGFFTCQNRAQQYFWKSEYQHHANGAQVIRAVYLASPDPARDARFIAAMFGGAIAPIPHGQRVACGAGQEIRVVHPQAIRERDPSFDGAAAASPVLAGIAVQTDRPKALTPAAEASGMFIEWVGE
ncbi:MAG: VOC family protein [Alphaproteobacteria bacterium]